MSLINQMLKDLESRQQPEPGHREVLAGIGTGAAGGPSRSLLIILFLLLAVIAAAGYLWWQSAGTGQQTAHSPAAQAQPSTRPAASGRVEPRGETLAQSETKKLAGTSSSPVDKPAVHENPAPATTVKTSATKPVVADSGRSATVETPVAQPTEPDSGAEEHEQSTAEESRSIEKQLRPLSTTQRAEQRYQQGYNELSQGRQQQAEALWLEALELDAGHEAARESLASLYLSQARRVEAAEQLQQGLHYYPGNGQFALLYARLMVENGNSEAALEAMERARQEQSQSADFFAFLAAIYQRQGDYARSIAAYRRALSQQPAQAVWWMGIGISLEGAGQADEALSAYREALDRDNLSPALRDYVTGRIAALES